MTRLPVDGAPAVLLSFCLGQLTAPTTRMTVFFGDARLRPIRLRTIRLRPAGRSRIWPKSKLAEVEINWPKSKLIGRSRTDGVCSISFSFFHALSFSVLFFSFLLFLTHLTFHVVFVLCLFSSQKPERNSKRKTLHFISDGPFRWTPPSAGQPSAGQPSDGQPSAGPPKISLFFFGPPPATIFILLSLSWGPFVEFCWCF